MAKISAVVVVVVDKSKVNEDEKITDSTTRKQ